MVDDREWSDDKLVVFVVSSSEYVGIFISILRVVFLSVDRLKLESLSSLTGKIVEITLGFLNAEFLEWMQIKSIASSIILIMHHK